MIDALPSPDCRRSRSFVLGLLALLFAGAVAAQERPAYGGTGSPVPQVGGTANPQAMVRAFLVPAGGTKASLQLAVKPQQSDVAPLVLAATEDAPVFGGSYTPIAPGPVVVEVRAGDKVVADGSVALRPARAYTFVAWQATPGGWQMKAFPDDPSSPAVADRAVRVVNFPAGRETLLSLDQGSETKVPANGIQELRAPAKVVGATLKVLSRDGGAPAVSSLEMDFSTLKSGYIVVVPDNLGRMRPQFIGGGYEEIVETAPAPAVASAPVSPADEREQRITGAQMELDHQQTILQMIKAREAAARGTPSATLLKNKAEAEKRLAELKQNLEAARSGSTTNPAP